jgi:hypothetical protein
LEKKITGNFWRDANEKPTERSKLVYPFGTDMFMDSVEKDTEAVVKSDDAENVWCIGSDETDVNQHVVQLSRCQLTPGNVYIFASSSKFGNEVIDITKVCVYNTLFRDLQEVRQSCFEGCKPTSSLVTISPMHQLPQNRQTFFPTLICVDAQPELTQELVLTPTLFL